MSTATLALAFLATSVPSLCAATTIYAFGIEGTDANDQISVIASIDSVTGSTTWSPAFHIPISDAGCAASYLEIDGAGYYIAPAGGEESPAHFFHLQLTAINGTVARTVNMSQPYIIDSTFYDPVNGLLYAVGSHAYKAGGFDVIAINISAPGPGNPDSGKVTVVAKDVDAPTIIFCASAMGVSPGVGRTGLFYFLTLLDNVTDSNPNSILVYDVASGGFAGVVQSSDMLQTVAPVPVPPAISPTQEVVLSLGAYSPARSEQQYNTSLFAFDPVTGANHTLHTFPIEWSGMQGMMVGWTDSSTGGGVTLAYALMDYTNSTTGANSHMLVTLNVTSALSPACYNTASSSSRSSSSSSSSSGAPNCAVGIHAVPVDDDRTPFGIYALAVAPA